MTKIKGEDWKTVYSEQVKEQMAEDPKKEKVAREMMARIRQALNGIEEGDTESIADALRSIGMVPIDESDIPEHVIRQIKKVDE